MHLRASVNLLPTQLNQASTDELSAYGCQDNPLNENNRVNRSGHRIFSDTFTRLDSRTIAQFESLTLSSPDLEEPEDDLSDLLQSYEVISEYPEIDSALRIISGLAVPSSARPVSVMSEHHLVLRPRLLVPEQVWKQKEIQKEPEAQKQQGSLAEETETPAEQTTEQREPKETPVIDVLTGLPAEELENKVWEFLVKVVGIASPAGKTIKGAATLVVSKEKIEKLQTGLKNILKGQVHYEVSENIGRRMLQLSKVCGSTSPSLPVLTLLGYTIPGYRIVPAMLTLWRLKDFKDEMAALYYDQNAMPALTDFTLSWMPALLSSLF
ncbi:hypothetical protein [Endozoicomonas sp. ALD040]|uniref:hypothetical protein n=1 Tax=Endozoicomonas sp. ALD040 TaxID=3403079 RepID=UPI003BB0614B